MRGLLIGQASVMAANGDRVEMEKGHATEFLSRTKLKHTAIIMQKNGFCCPVSLRFKKFQSHKKKRPFLATVIEEKLQLWAIQNSCYTACSVRVNVVHMEFRNIP
jgi:hypothetical protein